MQLLASWALSAAATSPLTDWHRGALPGRLMPMPGQLHVTRRLSHSKNWLQEKGDSAPPPLGPKQAPESIGLPGLRQGGWTPCMLWDRKYTSP